MIKPFTFNSTLLPSEKNTLSVHLILVDYNHVLNHAPRHPHTVTLLRKPIQSFLPASRLLPQADQNQGKEQSILRPSDRDLQRHEGSSEHRVKSDAIRYLWLALHLLPSRQQHKIEVSVRISFHVLVQPCHDARLLPRSIVQNAE